MVKSVCVYSASSTKIDEKYVNAARELGRLLAIKGVEMVNGAGVMGLMAECTNAAMENGGKTTGVIPQFMVDRDWHHTGMDKLVVTKDMHERKQTMADFSDGCIALPGGCGTFEEVLEVITWKQIGIYNKPIVIYNVDGYYDLFLQMLHNAVDERFMRPEHLDLWTVATTAEEAIEQVMNAPLWDVEKAKSIARI